MTKNSPDWLTYTQKMQSIQAVAYAFRSQDHFQALDTSHPKSIYK